MQLPFESRVREKGLINKCLKGEEDVVTEDGREINAHRSLTHYIR